MVVNIINKISAKKHLSYLFKSGADISRYWWKSQQDQDQKSINLKGLNGKELKKLLKLKDKKKIYFT